MFLLFLSACTSFGSNPSFETVGWLPEPDTFGFGIELDETPPNIVYRYQTSEMDDWSEAFSWSYLANGGVGPSFKLDNPPATGWVQVYGFAGFGDNVDPFIDDPLCYVEGDGSVTTVGDVIAWANGAEAQVLCVSIFSNEETTYAITVFWGDLSV